MADGDERQREPDEARRKTMRTAATGDDLHKDLGERKSVLTKKSLLSTQEQEDMAQRKPVIKTSDMSEEMQQDAMDCALQALDLEECNTERDVASYIRTEFEKRYNPNWHCIVGRNFGSFVSHERKNFIYFYVGQLGILLFKSG